MKRKTMSQIQFKADFINASSGAISRCLNDGSKSFTVRAGDDYHIFFNEPAYVEKFEIVLEKSIFGSYIDISVMDQINNKEIISRQTLDPYPAKAILKINRITTGISIKLHPDLYEKIRRKTIEIKKIIITGYFAKDFYEINESIKKITSLKKESLDFIKSKNDILEIRELAAERKEREAQDLEDRKNQEIEHLEEKILETERNYSEWQKDFNEIKKDYSETEKKRDALKNQITSMEANFRKIDGEISAGEKRLKLIAEETAVGERKLKDLTSNVNLFSEEFSSFSDHGAKQAKVFIGLSLIPLLIILLLTWQLLSGAVDLSVKYSQEPNIDLLTIFVTRIPYLVICASILGACYSLAIFLFNRITYIYSERLDFSKIGIIAKDVSTASADNLKISDQELLEARTFLKIEILKAYLSGSIGTFTYRFKKSPDAQIKESEKKVKDKKPVEKNIIKEDEEDNEGEK